MASIEHLKAKAKQLEAKQNWRAAIDAWAGVVQRQEAGHDTEHQDLSIYNRLGDLYLKVGDPAMAADCFDRAVDRYTESGFDANAIALCNKVLRYAPGRTAVYLKLAKLMARRGFIGEAKHHFLSYAKRMQKAGKEGDAVAALRELTSLAPNSEELLALVETYGAGQRRSQIVPLPPEPEPESDPKAARRRTRSLIFLDIDDDDDDDEPEPTGRTTDELPLIETGEPSPAPAAHRNEPPPATEELPPRRDVEFTALVDDSEPPAPADVEPLEGLETHVRDFEEVRNESGPVDFVALEPDAPPEAPPLEGLEPTQAEPEASPPAEVPPLEDLAREDDRVELVQAFSATEVGKSPDKEMDLGTEGITTEGGLIEADDVDPGLVQADFAEDLGIEGVRNVAAEEGGEILMEFQAPTPAPEPPPPAVPREPTPPPGLPTVEALEDRVLDDPGDPEAHRALAEALIERGDRERGLDELDIALRRYEEMEQFDRAREVGHELVQLEPNNVRVLQKLVEVTYRSGDRSELVGAYLELGDALFRSGELAKALAVYERVLEHEPHNTRAQAAMGVLRPAEEPKADAQDARVTVRDEPTAGVSDFVDLGALILGESGPRDTRLRIEEEAPTGDEQRDFNEMLEQFRRGIDENLGADDYQAHYDLGVAFKEMDLLDDAIAEFQKALRGPVVQLQSHEALGACFFEKGQSPVAEAILRRGLQLPAAGDEGRVGILYWLARALEAQGKRAEALELYRRVFAVDIRFYDVQQRVRTLTRRGAEGT